MFGARSSRNSNFSRKPVFLFQSIDRSTNGIQLKATSRLSMKRACTITYFLKKNVEYIIVKR